MVLCLAVSSGARAGSLTGSVTRTDTNQGVAGAQVLIRGTGQVTESGPDGSYSFASVPNGSYGISCSLEGLRGESSGAVTIGDDTTRDIGLHPPAADTTRIFGTITCQGTPCQGALVTARQGGTSRVAVSDPAGSYSIESLPEGSYEVRGIAFGHLPDSVADVVIDPPPDGGSMTPREVNLALGAGDRYGVSGVVGLSDNPLERDGSTVRCNGLIPTASASTTSGGSYQLTGLPAGLLSFTAARSGYRSHTQIDVLVTSDRSLDFILTQDGDPVDPTYSLSGTVTLEAPAVPDGGTPVSPAGTRVSAWATEGDLQRTTTTDGDGRYRIDGLPPDRYQAGADREGFLPEVAGSFQLSADHRQDFTLQIDPAYDWGPGADGQGPACGCQSQNSSQGLLLLLLLAALCLGRTRWSR
jgi:hypothetical protein